MDQTSRECWTVRFSSFDENVLAVGYEDGTFAEYELRTNRVISQEKLPGGVCSIAQLQLDGGLQSYAWSTSSSHVGLLHAASPASPASQSSRQLQQVAVKASHDKPSTIWSVKQLPGVSRAFACCSGAGDVSFFCARPEEAAPTFGLVPMGSSKVCAQPILHLDFHPTMQIPVCALSSLDRTIRIVTVNRHPLL
ncbi:MAG: hypothetical protein Q8P67_10380 [archaeon]|nr:hypothetical protein [archaeon]